MSIFSPWQEWFRLILSLFRRRDAPRVFLVINRRRYELHPNRKRYIMIPVNVGHEVDSSIGFLDANGNPMLVTPTPDAPPTWANSPAPAGAAVLTVSPDGLTSVDKAAAAGTDTLTVSLSVNGVQFSATEAITISAVPQVLTSIVIDAVVS